MKVFPSQTISNYVAPLFTKTKERPVLYTLEMDLLGAPLPIRRTLRIPSNMNLGYVQEVLMLAMGWKGYHLKEIHYAGIEYFTRSAGGQDPEPMEGFPQHNSFQYTLGDLLKEIGDTFTFIYDFGDSWKHRVSLTDIRPIPFEETDGDYEGAELVSGQGACPPEDVGGVYGYADMLKSLSDPDDEEREEYLTWLGREYFDPNSFDLHELQNRVDDFQRIIGEARWGFYRK